jgi:hypothetical protein
MAYDLRRRVTRPYPCPSEPTASHRQGSPGRRTSGEEETWSLGVEPGRRGSGRRGGGRPRPPPWGEVCEVGLCQLDLLVHVITGRLSLTKSALNLGVRAESRRYRLRSDSAFPPRRRFAVPKMRKGAMPRFPRSPRGVLEMQRNCPRGVPPSSDRIPVQWLQRRARGATPRGLERGRFGGSQQPVPSEPAGFGPSSSSSY